MKKTFFAMIVTACALGLQAQNLNPKYLAYIEEWKDVAVQNQADFGIPAPIIMAQALLESGAGQSELALNANNHFGIKCTGEWMGAVYYHDDDKKDDCFRSYGDAAESFKDHALFLQRPRYATCFEIAVEDYEGWAYRLRECGYATDRNYAPKLIKLIEDYRLDTLGRNTPAGKYDPNKVYTAPRQSTRPEQNKTLVSEATEKKAAVVKVAAPIVVVNSDPEPPYTPALSAREEKEHFFLMHAKKKCNGVAYVEAREGDTYANVAFRLNVRERDLRENNDALGRDLKQGDRIYLSAKKQFAPQEKALLWVHPGESLWEICQREGVQMQSVQKLNELDPAVRVFHTRQQIYLRKVKEENGK
ncbi:MAG: glucosaminidase domain-containing protein [Paludibacteraceae bacterium]|nr:glucosaminidase domain-containing protein [Paludibacteraceae bacterium]